MKSLSKRVDEIEALYGEPESKPAAHVAMVKTDGSVTVKKPNNSGSFQLPNEEALDSWMNDNEMQGRCLKVIVVNSQGKMPKVE